MSATSGSQRPAPGHRAAVYVPIDQVPVGGGFLLLRTRDDPRAALSAVMTRVREVAPNLAVDRTQRVADVLERSRSMARFNTQLVTAFATLALLLSAVGVYGLTSGEVAARWREVAIRLALGAIARPCLVDRRRSMCGRHHCRRGVGRRWRTDDRALAFVTVVWRPSARCRDDCCCADPSGGSGDQRGCARVSAHAAGDAGRDVARRVG